MNDILNNSPVECPVCGKNNLAIKYEATYIYSYPIDSDAPGLKNDIALLPFLYDHREQLESCQYIQCNDCESRFPCYFDENENTLDFSFLKPKKL